jgi:hypothetical protein
VADRAYPLFRFLSRSDYLVQRLKKMRREAILGQAVVHNGRDQNAE